VNKSDYKILFVTFFNDEALGVRCLHSILHNNGYNVKMLFLKVNSPTRCKNYKEGVKDSFSNNSDNLTKKELQLFKDFVVDYKPNILAVSLVSSNYMLYKRIYSELRNLIDLKIVIGGWQPTLNPEECIGFCDYLCVGEGEEALPELVDKMFNNQPVAGLKNIWINEGDRIIRNPIRPLVEDLSLEPVPVFDDDLSYYIENGELIHAEPYKTNTRYGIITGRGCPYSCTYCSNVYMAKELYPKKWQGVRSRTIEHVMSELIETKAKLPYIESINFYDEVFMPKEDWAKRFFDRYVKEIGLPFYCEFYPGTCNEKKAKMLKEAGLEGVWLGVQSGSPRVRKEVFKRHYKNETVIEQAGVFHKYGISVRYDFILDNPFETFEESLETINLMMELPQPCSMNIFSLKYFPKTDITKKALSEGLINEEELNDRIYKEQQNFEITMSNENSDRNFINHLVTYISFLLFDSKLEKREISSIVDNYLNHKRIQPIQEALKPYLV
jgi:anaerobic magnesium-protoporphyrin IX monomethyl ester cyclase